MEKAHAIVLRIASVLFGIVVFVLMMSLLSPRGGWGSLLLGLLVYGIPVFVIVTMALIVTTLFNKKRGQTVIADATSQRLSPREKSIIAVAILIVSVGVYFFAF